MLQLPWLIRAASSDCHETCGSVVIRYPFGIRTGCYYNPWFRVTCNQTTNGPKPFISRINLELLHHFPKSGDIVFVNNPVIYLNCDNKGNNGTTSSASVNLQGSPFFFSSRFNRLGSVGCGYLAAIFHDNLTDPIASCLQQRCSDQTSEFSLYRRRGTTFTTCYAPISEDIISYTASVTEVINTGPESNRCKSVFINYNNYSVSYLSEMKDVAVSDFFRGISIRTTHVPAVLEWNPCDLGAELCALANRFNGCLRRCGKVDIPYPFGIEDGCYMHEWFRVTCNETIDGSKLYISSINLQLLNVSVLQGTATINNSITYSNCLKEDGDTDGVSINLKGTPFLFSTEYNIFMSVGCGSLTTFSYSLKDEYPVRACMQPICANFLASDISCSTDLPSDLSSFAANMKEIYPSNDTKSCGSAFMVDHRYLDSLEPISSKKTTLTHVPTTLQWSTPKRGLCFTRLDESHCHKEYKYCYMLCVDAFGSNCSSSTSCPDGYEYSDERDMCMRISYDPSFFSKKNSQKLSIIIGCSTSIGTVFALLGTWRLYKVLERRKDIKLKHKYFKRNGGLLLQQRFSNNDGNVENIHVFASNVLEKATDYYNDNRILGRGGQGTVYKGMLTDGSIVAIKKPILMEEKILDEKNLEQFINEVILLSQINHRNVVKLLGCCLETKVPLLVYEFISNGTLYQLIHEPNEEFPLNWEMRLRITSEIANALSYLHSAASVPIYHRDIKSSNILLDDKYRAKVSDFGTSKSIALEKTHVTTRVQGTFGYLDPEYFRSSQFTEKSDVYSFGVVLVEVLTGQKPVFSTQSEDEVRSLVALFLLSMQNDSLFEVLDRTVKDGPKTEIEAFAKLAKRCLNLNGKKRPTMKQVALELEWIRSPAEADAIEQCAVEDSDIDDPIELSATDSCSTSVPNQIAICLQKRCSGQTSEFSGCYSLISGNLISYTASAAKVINPGRKRCTSAFITYIDFRMSRSKDVSTADTVNFSDISIDTTHVPAVLEWNLYDLEGT
uniref:Protein kinase domain-containing protein n=1 Tax=Gossypium raimondii TaxID=29730 RepID=A0A0D2SAG9_GOSRA|nr:hypothetical protein B456_005G035300 [Gossypium raimondii]